MRLSDGSTTSSDLPTAGAIDCLLRRTEVRLAVLAASRLAVLSVML